MYNPYTANIAKKICASTATAGIKVTLIQGMPTAAMLL